MFNMTAGEGRKRSISCLVAVGNGNGAAGVNPVEACVVLRACRSLKSTTMRPEFYTILINAEKYESPSTRVCCG